MAGEKRVLLTGGGGMVGRNIREHPSAEGWEILAPRSAELDLTNFAAVSAYLSECRPDLVIHCAGRVGGIQANIASPVAFLEENVAIGRNVIVAAYKAGVENLINLASTCMYPRDGHNPLREESILTGALEPTNEGYALAKIVAMRLCDYVNRERTDANYRTLIPCNLYGRYDKFDPKHSHLVPAIIHKIHEAGRSGANTVEIWGDGTARREFMFAGDLADAVWKAAAEMHLVPAEMNIGLGHDHTINEYYSVVAEVIGWNGDFVHDLSKPVGMKQKLCSTERQIQWGWEAKTSLKDGIAQAYQYYLESNPT